MGHDDKHYAGCLLKAWKQYHMLHSHDMEIRGKIEDIQFAWGTFGDKKKFQLMCKKEGMPYSPIGHEDRAILIHALVSKKLEIIAFDTTLKLSMNLLPHFERDIRQLSFKSLGVTP